jgi:TRAP-type mannitol/chloroaromatic compound transport system permease small subunit
VVHLLNLATIIDKINRFFAHIAAACVLLACMFSAGNAISRYLFSLSSNAFLEIQWQLFAAIFLLGAPYVLKLNEHVRVDMFYGSASPRRKLWIDVFGFIFFLFPATLTMTFMAWPFFLESFSQNETSSNAGGLLVWPVKFLLPFGFTLLFLQGAAELIRRIAALRGVVELKLSYEKPLQ